MSEQVAVVTDVGVIGSGTMGRALVRCLVTAGHRIHLATSRPEQAQSVSTSLVPDGIGSLSVVSVKEAASESDVVILATPFTVSARLALENSDVLEGKIVVDVSNPYTNGDGLAIEPATSAAEEIARRAPGALVVKAFNTISAATLTDIDADATEIDVFVASDSKTAKARLSLLIAAFGLRPIDAGPLRAARTLEQMGLFILGLQARYGPDCRASLKLLCDDLVDSASSETVLSR